MHLQFVLYPSSCTSILYVVSTSFKLRATQLHHHSCIFTFCDFILILTVSPEALPLLFSTGWFKEWIQNWFIQQNCFHHKLKWISMNLTNTGITLLVVPVAQFASSVIILANKFLFLWRWHHIADHFSVWLLVILISESVLLVSCCQTLNSIVSFLITAYAFGVLHIWHAFVFWITLNRFFQSIQSFLNINVTHQVIIVPSIENATKQYCWCNTVFINLYSHMWRIHIWLLFGYLVIWLFGYLVTYLFLLLETIT